MQPHAHLAFIYTLPSTADTEALLSRIQGMNLSSSWLPVNSKSDNAFFKFVDLYNLKSWGLFDVSFEKSMVAISQGKGAVAITINPKHLLHVVDVTTERTPLYMASADTNTVFSKFQIPTTLVQFGWLEYPSEELLVCVFADGQVWIFNVQSLLAKTSVFSIEDCREHVSLATVQNNHVVALTSSNTVIKLPLLGQIYSAKPMALRGTNFVAPLTSVAVGVHGEVYVAVNRTVYMFNDALPLEYCGTEVVASISVAAAKNNKAYVAVVTTGQALEILDSNLKLVWSSLKMNVQFKDICSAGWAGADAVVVCTDSCLHLITPGGGFASKQLSSTGRCLVQTCPDAALLLSVTSLKLVQRVSDKLLKVLFLAGDASPGALLLATYTQAQRNPRVADLENSIITSSPQLLASGINECLQAACNLNSDAECATQQLLLKAAHFGRSFAVGGYDTKAYESCLSQVTLASLLRHKLGFPVSSWQLSGHFRATMHGLIQRCAFEMSYLAIDKQNFSPKVRQNYAEKVFVAWLVWNLKRSSKLSLKALLLEAAKRRLSQPGSITPNLQVADVARLCILMGKQSVAASLIGKHLHNAHVKVGYMLLLDETFSLDTYMTALESSVYPSLPELVLLHFYAQHEASVFYNLMHGISSQTYSKRALLLMEHTVHWVDSRRLQDFYYQEDSREQALYTALSDCSFTDVSALESIVAIRLHDKVLKKTVNRLSEQSRLVREQMIFDAEFSSLLELHGESPFLGNSLSLTVARLFRMGQQSRALKLAKDFEMDAKHLYWLQLQTLISNMNVDSLKLLATHPCPLPICTVVDELNNAGLFDVSSAFVLKAAFEMQPLLLQKIEEAKLRRLSLNGSVA